MTKRSKYLFISAAVIVILVVSAPFLIRAALLYWAKHQVHRTLANLKPEELRNLDAVPTSITLPARDHQSAADISFHGYLLRVPQPQSSTIKKSSVYLDYPGFTVHFLEPSSTKTYDAESRKLSHRDFFYTISETYHTRLADVDAQPDIPSVKSVALKLFDKPTNSAIYVSFAQFDQPDRRGFIMAVTPDLHRIHAAIYVPATATCCGMYFNSTSPIPLPEIHQFLANLQIDPAPPATATEAAAP